MAKYKIELAPSLRARMYIPGTVKSHIDLYPQYNPEVTELGFEEGLVVRVHTRRQRVRPHEPLMFSPTGCAPTVPRSPPRSPPPPAAPASAPSKPGSPLPSPPRCPTPMPQGELLDRAGVGRGATKRSYDKLASKFIQNRRCTTEPKRNDSLDSIAEFISNRSRLSEVESEIISAAVENLKPDILKSEN